MEEAGGIPVTPPRTVAANNSNQAAPVPVPAPAPAPAEVVPPPPPAAAAAMRGRKPAQVSLARAVARETPAKTVAATVVTVLPVSMVAKCRLAAAMDTVEIMRHDVLAVIAIGPTDFITVVSLASDA